MFVGTFDIAWVYSRECIPLLLLVLNGDVIPSFLPSFLPPSLPPFLPSFLPFSTLPPLPFFILQNTVLGSYLHVDLVTVIVLH